MSDINVGNVPFQEAISFFLGKVKVPTEHWDDMLGDIHAKAFTVAGATNMDVLGDLHQAVKSAIENGTTITEFRKQFDKTVQENGWSYKGKRGWRTRIIYDTNMRTAHMAGKWDQFQRTKATRPYLQYLTVGDSRVRPLHALWHNKVLPVDDAWFDSHYPPNGWGCRCTVRSLSDSQLKREGLTTNKAPPLLTSRRINRDTGEDYGSVPDGIDVGWNYNVGKAWLGPDIAFGKKAIDLPHAVRRAVLEDSEKFAEIIEKPFSKWVMNVFDDNHSRGHMRIVGYLADTVITYLQSKKIPIPNAAISVTDDKLKHMRRANKTGGKPGTRAEGKDISISLNDLQKLPKHLAAPDAVIWDNNKQNLLYIFQSTTEKKAKIAVNVQFNQRGVISNTVMSGSKINTQALNDTKRYILIQGKV